MLRCGVATMIGIVASIIKNFLSGMSGAADITAYEIQVASVFMCYVGYVLSINHLNFTDGAMLHQVEDNLKKVVETNPEFDGLLVPNCEFLHMCPEFQSCGRWPKPDKENSK